MRTITIKAGQEGRFDDRSPFLSEEGALALKFILPQTLGEYFLTLRNSYAGGANERTVPIPKTGEVTLEDLLAGELGMTVQHYLHGQCIARHRIEPLLIKETDKGVCADPGFADLERRLSEAETQLSESAALIAELGKEKEALSKTLPELAKRQLRLEANAHALLVSLSAFAWAVYRSSFTLNSKGLSAEEFLRVIGVDADRLSEDDRKVIGSLKEEL